MIIHVLINNDNDNVNKDALITTSNTEMGIRDYTHIRHNCLGRTP